MLASLSVLAAESPTALDVNTIVTRMQQAQAQNRIHFRPYLLTRDYKLYDKDNAQPSSEVIADISFQPPDNKQYQIKQSRGSSSGEKIVRRVLDHETEISQNMGEVEVSRNNYDFDLLRTDVLDGAPVYVLSLKPKRDDKSLIKGEAYVDANTFLIRRIVGRPAKNPSWWIKELDITLNFSEVKGMWMQTASQAVAQVRFVGKHVFTSQDLSVRTAEQVATATPPRVIRRQARPTAAIGVYGPR
jgi:guanylate kinase